MAKLVDFSNELLLIIVSYLATGDDVDSTALFNLCLTSRALLIVARPALYTCVRLAEPAPDPLKSLKVFLKTILAHPSLAKETQKLALINDRGIRYEWPALQKDPYFIDLSSSICGYPSEIEPDLCYYPLAIEVLTRLPNLKHIRFTAEIESPHSLLERMHELQAQTSVFSKLKTFHLYVIPLTVHTDKLLKILADATLFRHKKYENGPVDIKNYIPFLRYPSFEQFSTESDVPKLPGSPDTVNILTPSTIQLYWCLGPPATFEQLLSTCTVLTRFEFVIPSTTRFRTMSDVAHDPLVQPRDLITILLKTHSLDLRSLCLDYNHVYNFREPEFQRDLQEQDTNLVDNEFTYPSLHGFKNLTCLTIEFEKLVYLCNLPASLETLNLKYCYFPDLDEEYLSKLVRLKETWCPVIESVNVSGLEETNEGISLVLEHARVLDVPVQVLEDGRVLSFSGAASYLRIQSRVALHLEEADLTDYTEYYEEEVRRLQAEHVLWNEQ